MTKLYEYFDVVGGSETLAGYAFPEVHKFDASAFYNWEQDNLPILDLENRSDVLKQHMGLTNHTGVTLTVSADAPKSASANNVYQTVQDALAVVPRRLKFPVLIEICDLGNLGDLHIADIQCEGDGALQIESRQFLQSKTAVAESVSASPAFGPSATQTLANSIQDTGPAPLYNALRDASSTRLGISCSSVDKWNYHALCYTSKSPNSQDDTQLLGFAPFPRYTGTTFPNFLLNAGNSRIYLGPYNTRDEVTVADDFHPKTANGGGTSLFELRQSLDQYETLSTAVWGSHFNKITIRNSSKIKLKNIAVDSASGVDYQYPKSMMYLCETGLDVINSNILLENVAISRVRKTGLRLQDSSVSITGNFIINRIYDRTINRERASEGTGILAVDSTIAFDDTVGDGTNGYGTSIVTVTKCGVGVHAINSLITGGATCTASVANAGSTDTDTTRFYVQGNGTGIKLDNSVYELSGRTEVFCNIKGFDCYNSTVSLQQFSVEFNQEEGFYLNNSILQYGRDAETYETSISGTVRPAYTCDYNGVNIHADKNSSVQVDPSVAVHTKLDLWGGSFSGANPSNLVMSNHGTNGIGNTQAPAILINDNSNADLVHLAAGYNGLFEGGPGALVRAVGSSKVSLRGTSKSSTCLGAFGVVRQNKNWTTAATAALNNSNIIFTGPTKISKVGVGCLAESNSTVMFGPPTYDYVSWIPAVDRYQLYAPANHTKVDIHANRACVVANDKSTVIFKSLGGSSLDAANSVDSNQNYDNQSNIFPLSTSGSYVRFSPNGFTSKVGFDYYGGTFFDSFGRTSSAFSDSDHYKTTTGGMCVRVVGASKAEVNCVNFKVDGSLAPDLSGVCYNYEGTGCEHSDSIASGIVGSPTSNICDLVANCCDPADTTVVTTTAAATTATTSTTTTLAGTTVTPPVSTITTQNYGVDSGLDDNYNVDGDIEFSCVGSRIQLWNIADTSRIHAANILINGNDPATECVANAFHGPTGRWQNGAACDYYGKNGLAAAIFAGYGLELPSVDGFHNLGVFRIVGSHRGYLKTYSEVDYGGFPIQSQLVGGGSPLDQINCQGYMTMFDTAINTPGAEDTVTSHVGLEPGQVADTEPVFGRGLAGVPGGYGKLNGAVSHARMAEGAGMLWDEGQLHPIFPLPPLHLDWQGYIRNWLDESAASVFANARHGANKKVNLLSIYRSSTSADIGGEGRDTTTGNPTFGVGVRSLNMFDLNRLV